MNLKLGGQVVVLVLTFSKQEISALLCSVLSIRRNLLRKQFFCKSHDFARRTDTYMHIYRSKKCLLALILTNAFEIAKFLKSKDL